MTTEQTKTTALTLPQRAAVALGTAEHEKKLILLVEESKTITEIKNPDGRTQCHATLMTVANARIAIEKTGKAAREDATAFSKSVIAEEKRLIGIIQSEEDRLRGLRDKWDEAVEAERRAKIEAERQRIEKIRSKIDTIKDAPVRHIASDSVALAKAIEFYMLMPVLEDAYAEFSAEAKSTVAVTVEKLKDMQIIAANAERAARDAEQARIAEAERIKAEREELAKLRTENEARRKEDERKAAEERTRQEQELAAQRAEIARQQAEAQARLDAERAELDRKLAEIEAAKQAEEARRLAQIQAEETEQERIRLQAIADQALADAREPETVVTILDNDDLPDLSSIKPATFPQAAWPFPVKARPTDDAIIACIAETFNVPDLVAVDYLRAMDLDSIRSRLLIVDEQPA